MSRRLFPLVLLSIVALAVAGGLAWYARQLAQQETSSSTVVGASIGGPFELVDHNGRTVTQADFAGKPLLIYFGYTYCPDVCPTELALMAQALDMAGPAGEAVQPLFVSIDPQRDTPQVLSEYVRQFHPRLVGLTGTAEQVKAMASTYKVYYAKAPGTDADKDTYLMDHSSFIFLMGPDGDLWELFSANATPETIANAIKARVGT